MAWNATGDRPELMISDETKQLLKARSHRAAGNERMQAYYRQLQGALVKHFQIDEDMPFADLPDEFRMRFISHQWTPIE